MTIDEREGEVGFLHFILKYKYMYFLTIISPRYIKERSLVYFYNLLFNFLFYIIQFLLFIIKEKSQKSVYPKQTRYEIGKTHKKNVFLVVGPLRFHPPYTNGLVVHATFFLSFLFSLVMPETDFYNFFFFFPIFGLKLPNFREKKVFLLSCQGGLPSLHPQWSGH